MVLVMDRSKVNNVTNGKPFMVFNALKKDFRTAFDTDNMIFEKFK